MKPETTSKLARSTPRKLRTRSRRSERCSSTTSPPVRPRPSRLMSSISSESCDCSAAASRRLTHRVPKLIGRRASASRAGAEKGLLVPGGEAGAALIQGCKARPVRRARSAAREPTGEALVVGFGAPRRHFGAAVAPELSVSDGRRPLATRRAVPGPRSRPRRPSAHVEADPARRRGRSRRRRADAGLGRPGCGLAGRGRQQAQGDGHEVHSDGHPGIWVARRQEAGGIYGFGQRTRHGRRVAPLHRRPPRADKAAPCSCLGAHGRGGDGRRGGKLPSRSRSRAASDDTAMVLVAAAGRGRPRPHAAASRDRSEATPGA